MDFINWLKKQRDDDSEIGDLASDFMRTKHESIKSYEDLVKDMRSRSAHTDAHRALRMALRKYTKEMKGVKIQTR